MAERVVRSMPERVRSRGRMEREVRICGEFEGKASLPPLLREYQVTLPGRENLELRSLPANNALHPPLDPARLALPLQAACLKCVLV